MKNIRLLLVFVVVLCGVGVCGAELPRKASQLIIALPDGRPIKISDYRGKVVVVGFILTT